MLPGGADARFGVHPHPCRCAGATHRRLRCSRVAGHHCVSLAVTSRAQSITAAGRQREARSSSLLLRLHPLRQCDTIWSWIPRAHASIATRICRPSFDPMRATALLAAVWLPIACTMPARVHCPPPCVTVPVGYAMMQPSVRSLSMVMALAVPTHVHGRPTLLHMPALWAMA